MSEKLEEIFKLLGRAQIHLSSCRLQMTLASEDRPGNAAKADFSSNFIVTSESAPGLTSPLLPQGPSHEDQHQAAAASSEPRRPLPRGPMTALCLVNVVGALSETVLFPFAAFMVASFHVTEDPSKLGYYAGYLASSYFIGGLLSSSIWGAVSDRVGRRPVLALGVGTNAACALAFGFSPSFHAAMATRFLNGLFNGAYPVTRTVVSELCDGSNQSTGFSLTGACWGIGFLVGPALGGLLSEPSRKHPGAFPRGSLFDTFAYAPPCLFITAVSLIGLLVIIFFLPETLGRAVAAAPCEPSDRGSQAINGANPSSGRKLKNADVGPTIQSKVLSLSSWLERPAGSALGAEGSGNVGTEAPELPVGQKGSPPIGPQLAGPWSPGSDIEKASEIEKDEKDGPWNVGTETVSEALRKRVWCGRGRRDENPANNASAAERGKPGLAGKEKEDEDEEEEEEEEEVIGALRAFFCSRDTLISAFIYALLSLCACSQNEVFPLWALTDPSKGGLGFGTDAIGLAQASAGLALTPFQLLLYGPLSQRLGPLRTLQVMLVAMASLTAFPAVRTLQHLNMRLLGCMTFMAIRGVSVISCYTSVEICLTNSIRYPQHMGAIHGIAHTLGGVFLAAAPTLGASIYAWSISGSHLFPLDAHLYWLLWGLCCALMFGLASLLPQDIDDRKFAIVDR